MPTFVMAAKKDPEDPQYFTLDEILSAADLPTADLLIPEWGNKRVQIGTITAAERLRWIQQSQVGDGKGGKETDLALAQMGLVVAALRAPVIDLEGAKALMQKSAGAWQRLQQAVLTFNKLDSESVEAMALAFRPIPDPGVSL